MIELKCHTTPPVYFGWTPDLMRPIRATTGVRVEQRSEKVNKYDTVQSGPFSSSIDPPTAAQLQPFSLHGKFPPQLNSPLQASEYQTCTWTGLLQTYLWQNRLRDPSVPSWKVFVRWQTVRANKSLWLYGECVAGRTLFKICQTIQCHRS